MGKVLNDEGKQANKTKATKTTDPKFNIRRASDEVEFRAQKTKWCKDGNFIANGNNALNMVSIYEPKNIAVTFIKLKGSIYKSKGRNVWIVRD